MPAKIGLDNGVHFQQQSELRNRIIAMYIKLGEIQLLDALDRSASPDHFECDSENLIETVGNEAYDRWKFLTNRYDLEGEVSATSTDVAVEVKERVITQLMRMAERCRLRAWADYGGRLERESAVPLEPNSGTNLLGKLAAPPNESVDQSASHSLDESVEDKAHDRALRRRAFVLPILASKGWTRCKWATEAGESGPHCQDQFWPAIS